MGIVSATVCWPYSTSEMTVTAFPGGHTSFPEDLNDARDCLNDGAGQFCTGATRGISVAGSMYWTGKVRMDVPVDARLEKSRDVVITDPLIILGCQRPADPEWAQSGPVQRTTHGD
jgi:hypothetical protein